MTLMGEVKDIIEEAGRYQTEYIKGVSIVRRLLTVIVEHQPKEDAYLRNAVQDARDYIIRYDNDRQSQLKI